MSIIHFVLRSAGNFKKTCVLFLSLAAAQLAYAGTFTVTNTNDSGAGSLRQAILDANGNGGLDTIAFNIPGSGIHTITPTSFLPPISDPVVIDGETQPGASANTLANGDNAVLLIELSGSFLANTGQNALTLAPGADGSTIRGLVIDNFWYAGVYVEAGMVTVEGCFLGTDPTGMINHGNTDGVGSSTAYDISGLKVGGTTPAARNVISGELLGVTIQSGTNSLVQGNFFGTDATGTNGIANDTGVDVRSSDNTIGGTTTAARNVFGANSAGIFIGTSTGNVIQGNFIGTDVTGTVGMGLGHGIYTTGNAQIGGLTAKPGTPPGNLISGRFLAGQGNGDGIYAGTASNNNVIQGNLIGTDATGTLPLGNGLNGIEIIGSSNTIGGTDVMARNVISANSIHGIVLGTSEATVQNNVIQGNFIGTDITGKKLLGNTADGVNVQIATDTSVGGTLTGAGNVIAGNGGNGVTINSAGMSGAVTGNSILANSIFSNGGLGIDLQGDGVTLNDPGDADTGENNLQNYPVITNTSVLAGNVTFTGSLNSEASKTYRLDFFASSITDPSGHGEGETFLGFKTVTTNATGDVSFSGTFPIVGTAVAFSATATDPAGNTSEFSGAFATKSLNISTRGKVLTGDNVLIGGFIVTGTSPINVIVRAIGPSLGPLGVSGALADPVLELHKADGTVVTNDNWRDTQEQEIIDTTIAPTDDRESAIVQLLPPGGYTAIVSGKNATTGIGLVEAYDLDQPGDSRLANISTRGFVDTGDNVMIGGFIVGPADLGDATVLVRAIGPSLTTQGVTGALQDPFLELHDGNGLLVTSNDNWKDTQQAEIEATTIPPTDDRESALVSTLAPGSYTAIVSGKANTVGVGLVEVYHLQ